MTDYNIHLLNTVVHKFTGLQLRPETVPQAFTQGESIPDESIVDISIRSTFVITRQGRFLQTHFQIDDIRLPEDESHLGYRLQFCLFAIFEVNKSESKAKVEKFTQTQIPNILAPLVSDNHSRLVSILQPGISFPKLQPHIPTEMIRNFIDQNQITFSVVNEPDLQST
jgi:hypothetical protein